MWGAPLEPTLALGADHGVRLVEGGRPLRGARGRARARARARVRARVRVPH